MILSALLSVIVSMLFLPSINGSFTIANVDLAGHSVHMIIGDVHFGHGVVAYGDEVIISENNRANTRMRPVLFYCKNGLDSNNNDLFRVTEKDTFDSISTTERQLFTKSNVMEITLRKPQKAIFYRKDVDLGDEVHLLNILLGKLNENSVQSDSMLKYDLECKVRAILVFLFVAVGAESIHVVIEKLKEYGHVLSSNYLKDLLI